MVVINPGCSTSTLTFVLLQVQWLLSGVSPPELQALLPSLFSDSCHTHPSLKDMSPGSGHSSLPILPWVGLPHQLT